jgi:hypothetical protein
MDGPNDITTALAKVDGLIGNINADLRRMPDWKRNLPWHLDRVAERRRLMGQRDTLLARQCELALMN